jgi:hypothetical protein
MNFFRKILLKLIQASVKQIIHNETKLGGVLYEIIRPCNGK